MNKSTTATTPRTRSRGSTLDDNTKKSNREISRTRSAVERCIAHLKNGTIIATGALFRGAPRSRYSVRRWPLRSTSG